MKPGIKTTEFWLVFGIDILEGLRLVVGNGLTWQEIACVLLLNAIYVIQRLLVKIKYVET